MALRDGYVDTSFYRTSRCGKHALRGWYWQLRRDGVPRDEARDIISLMIHAAFMGRNWIET